MAFFCRLGEVQRYECGGTWASWCGGGIREWRHAGGSLAGVFAVEEKGGESGIDH